MRGMRKFVLGLVYLLGMFAMGAVALLTDKSGVQIGAVSSMAITLAGGLAAIVWGNAKEHAVKKPEGEK
jgi:hypothetical protein